MYLTRFIVNPTRREARRMLASPYRMHAAVSACFPPSKPTSTEEGRVLWRIDEGQDRGTFCYIVSPSKPSLVSLDEQIGWPDLAPQWETRDYDSLLAKIDAGQRYVFRLKANPVVSRSKASRDGKSSKRFAHVTTLQMAAWLVGQDIYIDTGIEAPLFMADQSSRAERNGFRVERDGKSNQYMLLVSHVGTQSFERGRGSANRITMSTAQYDGVLTVTDADLFRHALCHGIGHSKGFGCGLMTIVPESR